MIRLLAALVLIASPSLAADKIGQAIPITGAADGVASRLEEGMSLALAEARARGAEPGVTLVDTGCDAAAAKNAGEALKNAEVEIVVGPLCAEAARVIAAIVAPVPVVSLDTRNPLLDRHRTLDGLSLFEVGPAPEAEATVIVQHVLPTFGDRPFAVIDDGGVYARGLAEAIRLQAMDAGLEPTEVANFRPLQRTQKPLLRRLARSGIEALVVAADAEDVSTIANDLAELGLDWPVVTGEPARLLPFVEGASSVPDGLLAIMPVDVPDAIANALKPRLVFQDDDVSDTLVMGHALMSIALNYDPTKPLSETGSPSLLGLLTFAEDARATPLPMAVHRWQNGAFVRARP